MRLDSIFKALGVESIEDIERLSSFFVAEPSSLAVSDDPVRSRVQLIVEDEAQLIHPNEVVDAIRRFTENSKTGGAISTRSRRASSIGGRTSPMVSTLGKGIIEIKL